MQVALGVRVEPEGARRAVQHLVGRPLVTALLQAQVVLHADAGEQGDLLAARPRHPPPGPRRQAGLLGAQGKVAPYALDPEGAARLWTAAAEMVRAG
ncbi:hypothetical protein GCM10018793_35930 [Streptomyces sulfonofaciens]|uniref:Uncharacterized protein n=1 Tax=Streptomyces sulfonofaciens TaxID=68272 RepID=A0A919G9P2_9ACTN|nr:hypothetical protein GCM10018793_35930 [Streptomyces sulfonofaciens]